MSRVLVLGGDGMLGHKVCQELPRRGHALLATVRRPDPRLAALLPGVALRAGVDALEPGAVERAVGETCPEFVVNAIGLVGQPDAARDRALFVAVNAGLPHRLARACREGGARLLHLSSDGVFSGRRGRYVEEDLPDPDDFYGRSKLLGEPDPEDPAVLTLRGSIIGREIRRPARGLVEWFLAQRGGSVRGFTRTLYAGFTTIEMARIFASVIERHPRLHGTYHVASEPIPKHDLLILLREAAGLDVEVQRDERVACDRSLSMRRFTEATGYRAPSWPDMVRELCADPTPYDDMQFAGTP